MVWGCVEVVRMDRGPEFVRRGKHARVRSLGCMWFDEAMLGFEVVRMREYFVQGRLGGDEYVDVIRLRGRQTVLQDAFKISLCLLQRTETFTEVDPAALVLEF